MRLVLELIVVLVVTASAWVGGMAYGAHRQATVDNACRRALIAEIQRSGTTHPLPLACTLAAVTSL